MTPGIAPFSPLIMIVGLAVLLAVRVVYGDSRLGGGDLVHLVMRVIGWVLVAMGLLALLEILLSIVFGILYWIVVMVALGSMIARYRMTERNALVWVLAIAAERQMPLASAVEAFAHEWGGPFGRRSLRLARALRSGVQLPDAVDRIRGIAPHSGRVAARVGTEAGCLGAALKEAAVHRSTQDPVWQGVTSRTYYLFFVLFMAQLVASFMAIRIAPAMRQIAADFGMELPALSMHALNFIENPVVAGWLAIAVMIQTAVMVYLLFHVLGWLPWDIPFLDRVTKALDTSLTARSLAWLVAAGKPLHTAVSVTARSYPKYWFRQRLGAAVGDMSNGVAWSDALCRRRIISAADAELLNAAGRVGNIPWALRMVADNNERRLLYRLQCLMHVLYPVVIIAVSLVIGLYAVAFFLPLVVILEHML